VLVTVATIHNYMKILSMATDDSYFKMYQAFLKSTNFREVFAANMNNFPKLDSVRSCLSIGTGPGEDEVAFMKHCAPNISKFLAVEPDHESVEHLRTSLTTSLPGVESQVFETTLQNWEGPSDPVDLILMFGVMYYFEADERLELFKKLHDRWLTSGGYVAIISESRTESGSGEKIFERLGKPSPPWRDMETDLQAAGFNKLNAHEMPHQRDVTDESSLRFYQYSGRIGVSEMTLDHIRNVLRELYPNGKADAFVTLAVFGRMN